MTRPILTISAILTASLTLVGCADKILSDDRIRDNTALALNMPPTSIVISDRRYDGMTNTYYTARTPARRLSLPHQRGQREHAWE